jgi:hypothetical protein
MQSREKAITEKEKEAINQRINQSGEGTAGVVACC